eukprot:8652813-Pyramimonas_sp.AAC.1
MLCCWGGGGAAWSGRVHTCHAVTDMSRTLAQRDDIGVHGDEALGVLQEGVRCYRYVTHPGAA